ncbi:unnamed protein product [Symbiodinium natans]|uniref:Uncharacterized protein n=1 Tax=Symbiodinium natans TaxID=878477 RepID=A0A812PY71_9DINO|nr:unnamed protein product [Symbiodinium natans]
MLQKLLTPCACRLNFARAMSMPSRADTQPMRFHRLAPGKATSSFTADFAAGLTEGGEAALVAKLRRRQLLSPLVPAEAVLREFPQAQALPSALAVLAEHTLTAAVRGAMGIWVVRDGSVVARTPAAEDASVRSFNLRVRPGDLLGLCTTLRGVRPDAELAAAVKESNSDAMVLRVELMRAEDAYEPLRSDAPHPSWRHAIFNEYGTHDKKL